MSFIFWTTIFPTATNFRRGGSSADGQVSQSKTKVLARHYKYKFRSKLNSEPPKTLQNVSELDERYACPQTMDLMIR
jgi:hypothetical protein